MALFQRGNTWWYDFTGPDGRRVRASAKTSNKQLAIKLEAKVRLDSFNLHAMGIALDRPFKDAVEYYLEIKRNNRTIVEYGKQLAWLQEQFKGVPLQKIDEDRIVRSILKKHKEGQRMQLAIVTSRCFVQRCEPRTFANGSCECPPSSYLRSLKSGCAG